MTQRESALTSPEIVVEGLAFGEGPRWHDGRLWFSDMFDGSVHSYSPSTCTVEHVVDIDGSPSGLGWDAEGRLLVVSMDDRRLLRFDGATLFELADLSVYTPHPINDMVVSVGGTAYIGSFGFDLHGGEAPRPTVLLSVDVASGTHRVAADELLFPNGMVITPDGSTLIVAEAFGSQLTAFAIEPDGALTQRREWAALPHGISPDGICLDADNCIWLASPTTREFVRVQEGGRLLTRHSSKEMMAIACMLGDVDRKTLYLLTSKGFDRHKARELRTGRISRIRVDVPGTGWP
jgi:sugar lactone lactonase YvrE